MQTLGTGLDLQGSSHSRCLRESESGGNQVQVSVARPTCDPMKEKGRE